ncbi:ABC transporter ATP-binding protein [Synechococcus sp. MIT S9508]|uniref:ABC transporter ATP-binding protein n=1 Tax=Synechococcus sp. MIT S9508 TaxID=1801629 RepID=UPI0007BC7E2B|nr:ABC transporter ATP-binding protein [Synechococcus sp. MIT S9508]KZR90598.1 Heterocyst differentiation ATP-binding protein HepA [Synechococcus sp. MIT S9508]
MTPASIQPTRTLLLDIFSLLSRRRRIQLGLLLVVMLASGVAELVSLGTVLPFLAVLTSPEQLWQKPLVQALALRAGFIGPAQLLLPATSAFVAAALVAATVRLTNLWLNTRLAAAVGSDLSGEVYRRTLYQPYVVHVQRNSSTVINTITLQVGRTVGALNSVLILATSLMVAAFLLIGLLLINWKVALLTTALFGSAYIFIVKISRSNLSRNSRQITAASGQLVKAVQEGLGAIRDVLLDGSQPFYQEIYLKADRCQRQLQAKNDFLASFPRFVLEALGMVAIALLGLLLVGQKDGGGEVIPLLGALALGAQRLLPALQQAYTGWASLKSFNADLAGVIELLKQPLPPMFVASAPLELNHAIQLQGVRFRYAPQLPEVLSGLDLEIRRGERIGLVGSTGSGKSTTVDLLMGLLVPSGGRLLVDGLDLHDPLYPKRLLAWRAAIAHVPQSIYLADASIAENIAFGIPKDKIDLERVRDAAAQAQIASFIEGSDGGYKSFVGERGIRLSGGQRQRIGIARALYKEARVLVFDEATSSLDNTTEQAVMHAIDWLSKELTIVIIAHRLSTVQNCDRVIRLEMGKLYVRQSS